MSDVVISVEGLSKSYLVGHDGPRESYHSLRDTLVRHGRNYVRKAIDMARGRQIIQGDSVEEFWALKDVSFEVKRGEVLGIIGRNGAGKSTLLKILSRITEPTSGRVVLDGRVASLLEVGTGFHPELTGRENIFLNGAILGMSKVEIRRKFDEIVDFAGVEKFLDTPVKRYSSGMYVRLAFAVAAHLEPEILIIDEVLAVGDAEFQKKCLGKMGEVAKSGRTVLFVSHDTRALLRLCDRGILLADGRNHEVKPISECVSEYQSQGIQAQSNKYFGAKTIRSGTGELQFKSCQILSKGTESTTFNVGDSISLRLGIATHSHTVPENILIAVTFKTLNNTPVFCLQSDDNGFSIDIPADEVEIELTIPSLKLYPGTYLIDLWIGDQNQYRIDLIPDASTIEINQGANSNVIRTLSQQNGLVLADAEWENISITISQ